MNEGLGELRVSQTLFYAWDDLITSYTGKNQLLVKK